MKKSTSYYVVGGVLLFAIVGAITQFIDDPIGFFLGILLIAVFVGIIYFVVTKMILKKSSSPEEKAYKKAVKQSKKRMEEKGQSPQPKKGRPVIQKKVDIPKKKRTASHLTVIDGKKDKKKDRA